MRSCGILMPIFSLPSPYGIGTLGKDAFRFADFLKKSGQSYWQILPLNPTNYGDSPYQSFSSFAGNPYFIDLDLLVSDKLLTKKDIENCDFGDSPDSVDYGKLYSNRINLLRVAFSRFKADGQYKAFVQKNAYWLDDYALFMALKNSHEDRAWYTWEKALRYREAAALDNARQELCEDINFYCFVQFLFDKQWCALKNYVNSLGIRIIGDIPIYVAYDSADVWANPEQFLLDRQLRPTKIAGVPPDAFCKDGQVWGNPLYNWKHMANTDFSWWKHYIGHAFHRYDVTRIDHFRGFESFFAIPYGDKTAQNGRWIKGPDIKLFDALKAEFGDNLPIIAEDLGFLTPAVLKMLKASGFAGMKVLQFAFDGKSSNQYLPHNFNRNCVVYTGTHDNDTVMGWLKTAPCDEVENAKQYLNYNDDNGFNWAMINAALSSVADTCILMMSDLIGAGSEGRINTPSTLGNNWQWRIDGGCINDWLAKIIHKKVSLYGRLPRKDGD